LFPGSFADESAMNPLAHAIVSRWCARVLTFPIRRVRDESAGPVPTRPEIVCAIYLVLIVLAAPGAAVFTDNLGNQRPNFSAMGEVLRRRLRRFVAAGRTLVCYTWPNILGAHAANVMCAIVTGLVFRAGGGARAGHLAC
jgi:hypothetical protein